MFAVTEARRPHPSLAVSRRVVVPGVCMQRTKKNSCVKGFLSKDGAHF